MFIQTQVATFSQTKCHCTIMLGIKTRRAPIGGDIANQIRDAVARVATGQLNERERAQVERSKRLSKQYEAHWFGLDGKEIQRPY